MHALAEWKALLNVIFSHHTDGALRAAVSLANSMSSQELLSTEHLKRFYDEFGYTDRRDGEQEELSTVQAVRPTLRALLTARGEDAVAIVNNVLSEIRAVPRLVRHDPWGWHVHAVAPSCDFATRVLVETAMAMIDVIRADEQSRLSTCEQANCCRIVLDLSRNRSKRFCSTGCGNRAAVSVYRARKKGHAVAKSPKVDRQ
ncbi:CGNR zinc finger domain-containing protein [Nocardioides sp. J9]|uniref:CGNR zinc finger domain-containing protein n=1 Tax=Nocardioides sp. J9 TaxID=935844 RepID=UPI0021BD5421|nr:CGNR zinc finger domain-containing protein [Nocardioides sp. J9]